MRGFVSWKSCEFLSMVCFKGLNFFSHCFYPPRILSSLFIGIVLVLVLVLVEVLMGGGVGVGGKAESSGVTGSVITLVVFVKIYVFEKRKRNKRIGCFDDEVVMVLCILWLKLLFDLCWILGKWWLDKLFDGEYHVVRNSDKEELRNLVPLSLLIVLIVVLN
nr:hypothetical protein [Tanacetum cinerariifolium]